MPPPYAEDQLIYGLYEVSNWYQFPVTGINRAWKLQNGLFSRSLSTDFRALPRKHFLGIEELSKMIQLNME